MSFEVAVTPSTGLELRDDDGDFTGDSLVTASFLLRSDKLSSSSARDMSLVLLISEDSRGCLLLPFGSVYQKEIICYFRLNYINLGLNVYIF